MKKLAMAICFMILCSVGVAHADFYSNVSQNVTLEQIGGSYYGTGMYAGYSTSYGIEDAALLFSQPVIPAGQAISDVTLNFYIWSTPSTSHPLGIYSNPNTNWTAFTATYSNFGLANNNLVSTIPNPTLVGGQDTLYSVDVTSYIQNQLAQGNNSFAFVLGTTDASQQTKTGYYGIEGSNYLGGALEAYLDYQTTPVATTPIPAGIWLFGSGLAGLVGLRKKIS
jgi:hypothetical protein